MGSATTEATAWDVDEPSSMLISIEFALPLQSLRLLVEPPGKHDVGVHVLQHLGIDGSGTTSLGHLTVRCYQLEHRARGYLRGG